MFCVVDMCFENAPCFWSSVSRVPPTRSHRFSACGLGCIHLQRGSMRTTAGKFHPMGGRGRRHRAALPAQSAPRQPSALPPIPCCPFCRAWATPARRDGFPCPRPRYIASLCHCHCRIGPSGCGCAPLSRRGLVCCHLPPSATTFSLPKQLAQAHDISLVAVYCCTRLSQWLLRSAAAP